MRLVACRSVVLFAFILAGAAGVACSSSDDDEAAAPKPDAGGVLPDAGGGGDSAVDASASDSGDDIFTSDERAAMKTFTPLGAVPPDTTNAFADNAAAAVLGQRLFFDKSYSGPLAIGDDGTNGGLGAQNEAGKVACVSCHSSKATDDDRTKPNNVSLGTDYGTRNALSVVNSSFYVWTNWGGRFDSQWSLPLAVAENPKLMNSSRLAIAHMLWDKYKADYDAIFPVPLDADLDPASANASRFPPSGKPKAAGAADGPWEGMAAGDQAIVNRIYVNYGKAIAAYMRKVVSRNAPFDRFVAGDAAALDAPAKRGLKVFLGKGKCATCHSGPAFTDDLFHNLGVPQTGPRVPSTDLGRWADVPPLLASPFNVNGAYSDDTGTGKLTGLVQTDAQKGQFRTKSLRNVAGAAPYMHAGQSATLEDVMKYYARGGDTPPADAGTKDVRMVPLGLTDGDVADLVAFMKALDGEPIPASLLTDTSK